jgi:hypothetical protein
MGGGGGYLYGSYGAHGSNFSRQVQHCQIWMQGKTSRQEHTIQHGWKASHPHREHTQKQHRPHVDEAHQVCTLNYLSVSENLSLACPSHQELVNFKICFVEMNIPGVVLLVFEERVGVFQVTFMEKVKERITPRVGPFVTIRSYAIIWRCIV